MLKGCHEHTHTNQNLYDTLQPLQDPLAECQPSSSANQPVSSAMRTVKARPNKNMQTAPPDGSTQTNHQHCTHPGTSKAVQSEAHQSGTLQAICNPQRPCTQYQLCMLHVSPHTTNTPSAAVHNPYKIVKLVSPQTSDSPPKQNIASQHTYHLRSRTSSEPRELYLGV